MPITAHLRYGIDPQKLADFERYGRSWIRLVEKMGGRHHGYFLPSEGANNIAFALFTFPSFAAYEVYRSEAESDDECIAVYEDAVTTGCIQSYERTFMRPVLEP